MANPPECSPDRPARPGQHRAAHRGAGGCDRAHHLPQSALGVGVQRIKARGLRELVTVVGHAAEISAGEWDTVSGTWVNDREHGQQFKASFLRSSPATTAEETKKVLSSGMTW